jgi:hypothetical protein
MSPFSIVRSAEAWTVTGQGRRWGQFEFRRDAEAAARRLAIRAEAGGERSEVLVQEPWGEMRRLIQDEPPPRA